VLRGLDELPASALGTLAGLGVDLTAIGGVLVACDGSGQQDKLVDPAGASALAEIATPAEPPNVLADRIVELVLDGVVEVQVGGDFLTGPLAWQTLWSGRHRRPPPDAVARSSYAALAYAERLRLTSPLVLASRLYAFGRVPLSRRWSRTWPDDRTVLAALGRGTATLNRNWRRSSPGSTGWLSWTRSGTEGVTEARYKLYLSPAVEALTAVLAGIVGVLDGAGATRFKIGADAAGLLRPDKIVIYPADLAELEVVVAALTAAYDGVQPHGVPFSAQLMGDGLLSWSGDPPSDAGPVGSSPESWRWSVARRLAEYLVAAHAAGLSGGVATSYALDRLDVDGVDAVSFLPGGLTAPTAGLRRGRP
jgi:hypothetical protein